MDNEKTLQNHLSDLASRAAEYGYYTYSSFLSLAEQDILLHTKVDISYSLFGGFENAERKIAIFGSEKELGFSEKVPITCIKVEPISQKFADELSHRDFLGSVTGLGIKRDITGDIVIYENTAYLFCIENIADFITENLKKVKHTDVKCSVCEKLPEKIGDTCEERKIFIPSERADAIIAAAFGISRSESERLFSQKLVFADSRIIEKHDFSLKDGSIISVRGKGRFIYSGIEKTTRKGRFCATIKMYK